jgi:hypothetical protein
VPDYCSTYNTHSYTDFYSSGEIPRYVGDPMHGGYWVAARDYERSLADYNARARARQTIE